MIASGMDSWVVFLWMRIDSDVFVVFFWKELLYLWDEDLLSAEAAALVPFSGSL